MTTSLPPTIFHPYCMGPSPTHHLPAITPSGRHWSTDDCSLSHPTWLHTHLHHDIKDSWNEPCVDHSLYLVRLPCCDVRDSPCCLLQKKIKRHSFNKSTKFAAALFASCSYLLNVRPGMSEQWVEDSEGATIQYNLCLLVTASHNVAHSTERGSLQQRIAHSQTFTPIHSLASSGRSNFYSYTLIGKLR